MGGQLLESLSHHEHFPDIVAGKEELQRSVVMKQILDVAIIEDALQAELRSMLQAQGVGALDVIAIIRRIGSGVFRMKEGEQIPFRIQHRGDALDHRLDQRLGEIVGNVPTEDGVEFHVAEDEIFFEEEVDVDSARLRVAAVFGILGKEENVFVVNAMPEFSEMRDVRGRSWAEVQNGESFCAFEQTRELS